MPTTETLVVEEVAQDGAWNRVTFTDGTVASTKDQKIAKAAASSRGQEAEVVLNRGDKYTYLNKFGDVGESRSKPSNGGTRSYSGGSSKGSNPRGDVVGIQWAVGRALEALTLTDPVVPATGLTEEQQQFIRTTAAFMVQVRDELNK